MMDLGELPRLIVPVVPEVRAPRVVRIVRSKGPRFVMRGEAKIGIAGLLKVSGVGML